MVKTPPRLSRISVFRYLRDWDGASLKRRYHMLEKFIEDYTTIDPIDTDLLFNRAGGLIFTRFTVGMQIAFARRKPVWHYFQALNIFVRSLQGERYIVEFTLMGALMSTFEVLRVDEMKDNDKSYVFQFLTRMIEGCGGTRVKEFICSDTSYLESVVDCLTMCKNRTVIHHAKLFLSNMCQGNTPSNINMVSKYVISLLPCDFNPRVQALACRVLPIIIHQNHDIASHCYSLVVDALKTDYNEMLVDIGDTCLAMVDTPIADDLLRALMEAALPVSLSDNLETGAASNIQLGPPTSGYNTSANPSRVVSEVVESTPAIKSYTSHDTYFRQQYGSLFTLSFLLKNKPEIVDQMMDHGILGSIFAAIGTASYSEIQLAAIRLFLLVHELSPDCVTAAHILLPRNLLLALLSEVEDALQYLTAPMCVSLRRIGRAVQANWREWYDAVLLPCTTVQFNSLEAKISMPVDTSPIIRQIHTYCETLAELTSEGLFTVAESMPIVYLDDAYRDQLLTKTGALGFKSVYSMSRFMRPGEVGEAQIQADPALEGFRKYLVSGGEGDGHDNFEKFGLGSFNLEAKDSEEDEMGGMTDLQTELLENALKALQAGDEGEEGDDEGQEGYEGEGEDGEEGSLLSTADMNNEDLGENNEAKGAGGSAGSGGSADPQASGN